MAVEHIDVDAHAHLVAQFVGVERTLAGGFGRLQGLDLAQTRLQTQKGRSGGLCHAALGRFQVILGLVFQGHGFLDPVLTGLPGVQRVVEGQTDGGGVGVGLRTGVAIAVARHAVAAGQVQRGAQGGLGFGDFQLGHFQGDAGLCQVAIVLGRLPHPRLDAAALEAVHVDRSEQGLGRHIALAHGVVQSQFLDAQVVVGGDFLGGDQVKAGLGFARIGDGGGAHFKVALGSSELLRHGRFLGFDKVQAFLRSQHVKVRLAQAHDQFLFGQIQLGLGQGHLLHALLIAGLVGWTVERLAGAEGQRTGTKLAAGR